MSNGVCVGGGVFHDDTYRCACVLSQVNAVDAHGCSALHYAACRGHAAVVEVLWGAGADVDAADADGWTGMCIDQLRRWSNHLCGPHEC